MEAVVTWWKQMPTNLFLCHAVNCTVQVLPSPWDSKRTAQLQQEPPKKQCPYLSGGESTLTPIYPRQTAEVPWRYATEDMTTRSNPMNLLILASITLFCLCSPRLFYKQCCFPHVKFHLTCCIFSRSRLGLLTLSPYPCRCLLQGMTCSRPAPTLVKIKGPEAGLRPRGWSLLGGEALKSTGLGLAWRPSPCSAAGRKDMAHKFFTSSSLEEALLPSLQQVSRLTCDHFRFSAANSRLMRSSSSSELWRSRLACKRARTLQHWFSWFCSWLVARGVRVQFRLLSSGRRRLRSGRADLCPAA